MDSVQLAALVNAAYQFNTDSVHEMEFILVPDEDADYLAFRGTEMLQTNKGIKEWFLNWIDTIRDLRFLPWPAQVKNTHYCGHAGFIRGGFAVAKRVLPRLRRDKPLVITGHSMGGAIALIVGLLAGEHYSDKTVQIVTYGAPRVFYRRIDIPENVSIKMYRNGRDIVTYVPFGFHPVELTRVGKASFILPNVLDHSMKRYLEAIIASKES